jgi:hypothetical protein
MNALKLKFAQRLALANGESPGRIIMELRPELSYQVAHNCATQWQRDKVVMVELDRLRQASRKAVVVSLEELHSFLGDVLKTPISQLDENSPLISEVTETESQNGITRKVKMPDKLRAADMIAKLAGYYAPEKQEVVVAHSLGSLVESIMYGKPLVLDTNEVLDSEEDDLI